MEQFKAYSQALETRIRANAAEQTKRTEQFWKDKYEEEVKNVDSIRKHNAELREVIAREQLKKINTPPAAPRPPVPPDLGTKKTVKPLDYDPYPHDPYYS
jgi:hypothetical protein